MSTKGAVFIEEDAKESQLDIIYGAKRGESAYAREPNKMSDLH